MSAQRSPRLSSWLNCIWPGPLVRYLLCLVHDTHGAGQSANDEVCPSVVTSSAWTVVCDLFPPAIVAQSGSEVATRAGAVGGVECSNNRERFQNWVSGILGE